jgi:hypothetical protein
MNPKDSDVFFKDDALTKAVRSAGPLKVSSDGDSIMFIHKTIQERHRRHMHIFPGHACNKLTALFFMCRNSVLLFVRCGASRRQYR